MIEQSILYIQTIISAYGAWGVLVATLVEEIVAPIPSALVPLAAGFFLLPAEAGFALVGIEAVFLIALPVALGITVASGALYALAYYGGKPLIEKNRRWIGFSWRDVERIEGKMAKGKRDEITLFVLRIIPVIPGFALSAFCGVLRYPFSRFMLITFVGAGVRAFGLALLGWKAGEFYLRYVEVVEKFEEQIFFVVVITAVVLGAVYYFWLKRRKLTD